MCVNNKKYRTSNSQENTDGTNIQIIFVRLLAWLSCFSLTELHFRTTLYRSARAERWTQRSLIYCANKLNAIWVDWTNKWKENALCTFNQEARGGIFIVNRGKLLNLSNLAVLQSSGLKPTFVKMVAGCGQQSGCNIVTAWCKILWSFML